MTAEQWKQLQQKKTLVVVAAKEEIVNEGAVGTEALTHVSSEIPTDTQKTLVATNPPSPIDDVNPFGQLSDDASAVETVQQLIDPDPDRLPMIANNESPKAYAVLFAKAYWMQQHKAVERAKLRREIGNCLLKFGVSRKGKENRASAVLESLKFLQQQQFELEKSTGSKLMGK